MTGRSQLRRPIIAVILSFIFCGAGQIYLRRVFKGSVLILSFWLAIAIIWFAVSHKELKLIDWGGRQIMFAPSLKSVSGIRVTDIMKVTGTIQLLSTWIFGIADAWSEGKRQS